MYERLFVILNHKLSIRTVFNELCTNLLHILFCFFLPKDMFIARHLDPVRITRNISFHFGSSPPFLFPYSSSYCYYRRPKTIYNSYLFHNLIYFFSLLITGVIQFLLLPVAVFIFLLILLRFTFSVVMEHCTHVLFLCIQHKHTHTSTEQQLGDLAAVILD